MELLLGYLLLFGWVAEEQCAICASVLTYICQNRTRDSKISIGQTRSNFSSLNQVMYGRNKKQMNGRDVAQVSKS